MKASLTRVSASVAVWLVSYASMLMQAGRLEEADEVVRESQRRDPRLFAAPLLGSVLKALAGEDDGALVAMNEAQRLRPALSRVEIQRLGGKRLLEILEGAGATGNLPED